jgi:P27 family predicted phage terminase small subunit
MAKGRKPIPVHLKLLRGNPGHRDRHITRENLHQYEAQPERFADTPEPPPYLTGYGAEEWRAVARDLFRLRMLTPLDVTALGGYCNAYHQWRTAMELLADLSQSAGKGYVLSGDKQPTRRNPLVVIANEAAHSMLRFASEFGLTPAARSHLKLAPGATVADKFEGLLGG